MICERALEILNSIKDKKDILASYEEISELNENHLISEFKSNIPDPSRKNDLTSLKRKYLKMSNDIRQAYQNLVSLEGDYNHVSTISRFFTHLKIGRGARLKKDISDLHQFIKNKEIDLKKLKEELLKLNTEIESYDRAVKVNGIRVFLTPIGETMIDEIKSRRRLYFRELKELIIVLKSLDDTFNMLINNIGNIMSKNNFSAVWALYLLNTDLLNLITIMNIITLSERNYDTAQKRMMKLSFYLMNHPEIIIARKNRDAKILENELGYKYPENEHKSIFHEILNNANISTHKIRTAISLLGKLFTVWGSKNEVNRNEIRQYYDNLRIFIDFQRDLPMIGKKTILYSHLKQDIDVEMMFVLFILSFSTNLDSYNYFHDLTEDIPEGAKFFSAISSLFPWDTEETWRVLLRAQSNILKAQSAKFIPELMEYAILMCLNPNILMIENNISKEQLDKWKYLIIPTIHLSIYSFFEKDLESYIRRRPLAYIIAPRYYHHSMLHYHAIG
ncbi:MAG: hypothetical protein HWN81_11275 [Candidatus Lokiarchaeota archaeon]|nr:hypothetical protein [Candidatus Lokiarchaeota archaeon]